MHNTQQLRLMQLASSALPVGSFTWSQGLEWAVEIGWVKSVDDFSDWQIQQMEQNFFTVDLPLLARLYRACEQDDLDAARRWSAFLLAWRVSRGLRAVGGRGGGGGGRLVTDWEADCSREWRPLFADSQLCGMAWLAVRWRIPLTELALSLGYSWIESAVMAGVKLVPFGQQAAQRLIIALCDRYAQGLAQALATPDASLGSATPLAAIASARHETQYSRLFRS